MGGVDWLLPTTESLFYHFVNRCRTIILAINGYCQISREFNHFPLAPADLHRERIVSIVQFTVVRRWNLGLLQLKHRSSRQGFFKFISLYGYRFLMIHPFVLWISSVSLSLQNQSRSSMIAKLLYFYLAIVRREFAHHWWNENCLSVVSTL